MPPVRCYLLLCTLAALPALESSWVRAGADGRLLYRPDADGDRISDFAWCGYRSGSEALPSATFLAGLPQRTVGPDGDDQDDGPRIQAAIDAVAELPADADGWRGVVQLAPGTYEIDTTIDIDGSGIVLRGSGDGDDPSSDTILVHRTTEQDNTITAGGSGSPDLIDGTRAELLDAYVPVGARSIRIDDSSPFAVGDRVLIRWSGNDDWHRALRMDEEHLGDEAWTDGMIDLDFDRVVTRLEVIDGEHWLTVDCPLPNAVEARYSTFTPYVQAYTWERRNEQIGVEHLRGVSPVTGDSDEQHAWHMVRMHRARDGWVRGVTAVGYGRSVYRGSGSRLTVRDCRYLAPASEIRGNRRYAFSTTGQQELVIDCLAEAGIQVYAIEHETPGPIAVVDCVSDAEWSDSGPHRHWGAGVLWDNLQATGRWQFVDGAFVGRGEDQGTDGPSEPLAIRHGGMPAADPQSFRVSVRVRRLDAQARPALAPRVAEVWDRALFYLELDHDALRLKRFRFSNDFEVFASAPYPAGFEPMAEHRLTVINDGKRMICQLDGTEMFTYETGVFDNRAYVGLRVVDGEAVFDDFVVTDVDGETEYLYDDFSEADIRPWLQRYSHRMAGLYIQNRGTLGTGHGWSGANNIIWNGDAQMYIVQNPPTAHNWLIGSRGILIDEKSPVEGPHPPGIIEHRDHPVTPGSLYAKQLADRLAIPAADHRQYWLGDRDGAAATDAEAVHAEADWLISLADHFGSSPRRFDESGDGPAAGSFRFDLAAEERVAAAGLAVGVSGASDDAALIIESPDRSVPLSSLGLAGTSGGAVIDCSPWLADLADGRCHLAVTGAVLDWAVLDLVAAPANGDGRTIGLRLFNGDGGLQGIDVDEAPEGRTDRSDAGGAVRFDGLLPVSDHTFTFTTTGPSGPG